NSEIDVRSGSAQLEWLRADLVAARARCTVAYWHRPLFSSGRNGNNPELRDAWRLLYEFNADVIVAGHDHSYERFGPQDSDGRSDLQRGIRQFVVGTGGASLYEFHGVRPNSEARGVEWGILELTLIEGGYSWQFI